MGERHYPGLEIDEDMVFQRRAWRLQRVAWALGGLVLIAGLLGLLGNGPLAGATARSGEFEARYDRFLRLEAPSTLQFDMPAPEGEGEVRLRLSGGWVEKSQVTGVTPEPASAAGGEQSLVYTFTAEEGQQSVAIQIHFEPSRFGRVKGVAETGGERVTFTQWVYP
ncbi:MAG: hypothetical protein IT429_26510 [Gemmataceae bacterium]|nr:hypothetical protein [Gemmataceae bacterium]